MVPQSTGDQVTAEGMTSGTNKASEPAKPVGDSLDHGEPQAQGRAVQQAMQCRVVDLCIVPPIRRDSTERTYAIDGKALDACREGSTLILQDVS